MCKTMVVCNADVVEAGIVKFETCSISVAEIYTIWFTFLLTFLLLYLDL